ncbi:uncharacterized protein BDZ99DRAFT_526214 [Mytilinidion resinicola]|uniref:F-box domain-containing protein n=1 Tax=Mytilinidion resinicola TaxID=574789 RepID=A0A6A6Y7F7_9PEZI|nr:uncharacterized protein BDZ99DRAFT_526214 [Mytilinidion resinicola]KAF2803737.1 hypothetical protein BDZ99DRAFT_526214 [Mytilinidion resinicola]
MTDAANMNRKTPRPEDVLLEHHAFIKAYLGPYLRERKSTLRRSHRAKDKLTQLTQAQFQDQSTDIYDELVRREQWSTKGSSKAHNVPRFLHPNPLYQQKRNVARRKLASLSLERFQQQCTDVFHESERRYPHFISESPPRSPWSSRSPGSSEEGVDRISNNAGQVGRRGSGISPPASPHLHSSSRMMLLDLPPELLRQILHTLDAESFYVCLVTCKTFRGHALNSKALLKDQLRRIPGLQDSVSGSHQDAASLVTLFSRRATRHLHSGAAFLSDVHSYLPTVKTDWKNSTLVSYSGEGGHDLMLANVCADTGVVRIYKIIEAIPMLSHVIDPYGLSLGQGSTFAWSDCEVVKLAVCEPDLTCSKGDFVNTIAILYRSKRSNPARKAKGHLSSSPAPIRLVTYRLDDEFGPIVMDWFEMEMETEELNDVVAVAVSKAGTSFILTRWFEGRHPKHKLTKYNRRCDQAIPPLTTSTLLESHPDEIISSMQVRGKKLHLFQSCLPIPRWTVSNIRSRAEIHRRNNYLPDDVEAFSSPSLGKAIAFHHHHLVTDPQLNDGAPTCLNTALEVMLRREEHTCTTPRWLTPGRVGAFLLKAIHYCADSSCDTFDLEKDYSNLHHVFVARLVGLDLFNLSSLGVRMAISPKSHRIAMTSWKKVLVWAIDTKAFLDPGTLPEGPIPGDYAYLEGCGYRYYQSNPLDQEMVELHPVELPEAGVVFELAFRDEDELWAWTDRGLVKWKFGPRACGGRNTAMLE